MTFRFALLICGAFFLTLPARAAFQKGNGGGGLLCTTPAGEKLQSYDLFVGESVLGKTYKTRFRDFAAWNSRLASLSPVRAQMYAAWEKAFLGDVSWTPAGVHLVPTPDYATRYVPDNCRYIQIIVQTLEPHPITGKRFTIDREYWEALSAEDRLVLLTHELAYREALETDPEFHATAEPTILLNALLHADDFLPARDQDRAQLLSKLGFALFESHGFAFTLFNKPASMPRQDLPVSFCNDGSLKSGVLAPQSPLPKGFSVVKGAPFSILLLQAEFSSEGTLSSIENVGYTDDVCLSYDYRDRLG